MRSRKLLLTLLFISLNVSLLLANNTPSKANGNNELTVAYCNPAATTPWNNYITDVSFGTISNGNQSDKKSASDFPILGVGDYTNLSTDISAGNVHPITITTRFKYYSSTPEEGYVRVWIDYNRDDDFDDPGELVIDHLETITGSQPNQTYFITKNITVPGNAVAGASRMRIAMYRDDTPSGPCPTSGITGEFEDYGVTILNGADNMPPTPSFSTTNTTVSAPFSMSIDFNETVTGLEANDFSLSNATVSNLQGSGLNYTIEVNPTVAGPLTIQLPADKVQDAAGNLNLASNTLTIEYVTNPPEVYCVPGPLTPYSNYILGVNLEGIANDPQSLDDSKSANTNPVGVHDYTDLSANLEAGGTYEIEVSAIMSWFDPNNPGLGNLQVWIDYNRDGDFDDTNERAVNKDVTLNDGANDTGYTITETIAIPVGAAIGSTLMRVLISQDNIEHGPCDTQNFPGEYESYSLNILPLGATEDTEFDIVWEEFPANVITDGNTGYRKLYDNPFEYFRGCNVLESGEDGWMEFILKDDVKSNGDWLYVGLIDAGQSIMNNGTYDGNFLFAIRSDTEVPGQNVLILENGNLANTVGIGGRQNDVFRITRTNGTITYSINGMVEYAHTPSGTDPNTLDLEPVFYILKPGQDKLVNVDFNFSGNFTCDEFEIAGHYKKREATASTGGAIDLDIRGGVPPYTFMWSNTQLVGSNPTNLPAGVYTVTVTDATGLSKSEDIEIFTLHNIDWETIESGVSQSGDTYVLNEINSNDLFGCVEIPAAASGQIKIRLNEDIIFDPAVPANERNEFNVFFKDTEFRTDALGKYGMKFNVYGTVLLVDDIQYNQESPEVFGPDLNYNSKEYEYTIQFQNREVSFYKNQKFLYKAPILPEIENLRVELNLLSSEADGVEVDIQLSDKCDPLPNENQFVDLKRRLDGTFVEVENNIIRFRYHEDYAVPATPDADLICKVYDWHREELFSTTLNKDYGVNWKELELTSNLSDDEYYILEVQNANKGDTYFLRFKYKCPDGQSCN